VGCFEAFESEMGESESGGTEIDCTAARDSKSLITRVGGPGEAWAFGAAEGGNGGGARSETT
jgi:hypothetical protein